MVMPSLFPTTLVWHAMQPSHSCVRYLVSADTKPWDVPADYQVPVYDYTSADVVLGGSTTPPK